MFGKRMPTTRKLRSDRRGATAVEFALIATPLFILVFGLIELMLIFLISSALENGVAEISRDLRTGEFQFANNGQPLDQQEQAFRNIICQNVFDLFPCASNLEVDVQNFGSFGDITTPSPIVPTGGTLSNGAIATTPTFDPGLNRFSTGLAEEIVVVRAFVEWQILTLLIAPVVANLGTDRVLLQATTAFRNEPFPDP